MSWSSGDAIVGQIAVGERTVDRSSCAARMCGTDDVAKVFLQRQPVRPRPSGCRIEQRIRHVDEMKHASVEELPDLLAVVAAANEACVFDLARALEALDAIERTTRQREMIQRQLRIVAAFEPGIAARRA